jgi:hypothetical protein
MQHIWKRNEELDNLSKMEVAYIFYKWGSGVEEEKIKLWEKYMQCRHLFPLVENKPFSLFETLQNRSWPGGSDDVETITSVLETLKGDSIQAFYSIVASTVRREVMRRLTPESRERADAALTRYAMQKLIEWEASSNLGDSNYFLMTPTFLSTLEASARKCGDRECFVDSLPYKDYDGFIIGRCGKHSFHLAYAKYEYKCWCESK